MKSRQAKKIAMKITMLTAVAGLIVWTLYRFINNLGSSYQMLG